MNSRWSFSLVLLVAYLAVFHLWMVVTRPWIIASGWIATAALGVGFLRAMRGRYFLNRWDMFGHAAVILDVWLEATLIPQHGQVGFYLCAAAFVIVVGGYRAALLRRARKGA